jgi:pimeloyl-ACP methyl ester carboxylesterase
MRRVGTVCGVIGIALLISGCAMRRLKSDLAHLETYHEISGRVLAPAGEESPVVAVLWSVDEADGASNYRVVHKEGSFQFFVKGGRYYLMAFADRQQDGRFQEEDDLIGLYEGGRMLDLNGSGGYTNLTIELQESSQVALPEAVAAVRGVGAEKKFEWRERFIGEVTCLDNPLFCQEVASKGFWEPVSFAAEVGLRIYFLEPYDPARIPVLFVHGANGHPGNFRALIEQLDRKHFQPWVVLYPSGIRLGDCREFLSSLVSEARLTYQFEELLVVAHSMGGLVSRGLILRNKEAAGRCRIPVFITFATPWNGHDAVALGVNHAPAVIPSWYDMLPGSPYITALNEEALPEETRHHLFFAFEGKGGSPFSSDNTDGTVPIKSQLYMPVQEQAESVVGIAANHVSILSDADSIRLFNAALARHLEERGSR